MPVNSLGINHSAIPANLRGGLRAHAARLVNTVVPNSVRLAVQAPPEETLGALSRISVGSAGIILQALPDTYLSKLFSLDYIWPADQAAHALKQNFTSDRVAGILSVNGMQPDRRAGLIKLLAPADQFNVVFNMLPYAAASALSSDVLTPDEVLLMYSSNLRQLGRVFPKIVTAKATGILEAMSNTELKDFICADLVRPGLVADILTRRQPGELWVSILDGMPDSSVSKVLDDDKFPIHLAAVYAKQKLVSRTAAFSSIDPPRLLKIFEVMDKLPE